MALDAQYDNHMLTRNILEKVEFSCAKLVIFKTLKRVFNQK